MIREWLWKVTGARDKMDALEVEVRSLKRRVDHYESELGKAECKPGGYCELCEHSYKMQQPAWVGAAVRAGIGCRKVIACTGFTERKTDNGQKPDQE